MSIGLTWALLALVIGCGDDSTGTVDTQVPTTDSPSGSDTGDTSGGDSGSPTPDSGGSADSGGETGLDRGPNLAEHALAVLLGTVPGGLAGTAATVVIDPDGDRNLLIGASLYEARGLFLTAGELNGTQSLDDVASFYSGGSGGYLGDVVDGTADLDGDGISDAVARSGDSFSVLCGAQTALVLDPVCADIVRADGNNPGSSLSILERLDAQGQAGIVIGDERSSLGDTVAGAAYIFRGPLAKETLVSGADATIYNTVYAEYAGTAVAGDGDVNGDGLSDIGLGAPGVLHESSWGGQVYLFHGPVSGLVSTADADGVHEGHFGDGQTLSFSGDLNGDGYDEVIIGSTFRFDVSDPLITVYRGGPSGPELGERGADLEIIEDSSRGTIHQGIGLADLDGDGADELGICSGFGWREHPFFFLFRGLGEGSVPLTDADVALEPSEDGDQDDQIPCHLSDGADFDGDGVGDFIVSVPESDLAGVEAGAVYLISGGGLGL